MLDWDLNENINVLFIAEDYSADDDCCADSTVLPRGRDPNSLANPDSLGIVNGLADLDQRLVDHDLTIRTRKDSTSLSMQIEAGVGE